MLRRAFVGALSYPLFGQISGYPGQAFEADWRRYADPATEFEVLRLTDPAHASYLPGGGGRVISRKSDFLVYASRRAGGLDVFRLELKSGQSRQLTQASALQPDSLTLTPDDKNVLYADGSTVRMVSISSYKTQEVAQVAEGSALAAGPTISDDGQFVFWAESTASATLLRKIRLQKGAPETVAEAAVKMIEPLANPKRATVAWRQEDGTLWVSPFDGSGPARQVSTPPGRVLQAQWGPDGRTLVYLHAPEDKTKLHAIREQELDARTDRQVAGTSQFVRFGRNANASVFVGGSLSKASPSVLLLLRATRREFTLCEHRSGTPERTNPMFSPNSQRIVFESDRDGKPALFTMVVDKLVEKTES